MAEDKKKQPKNPAEAGQKGGGPPNKGQQQLIPKPMKIGGLHAL